MAEINIERDSPGASLWVAFMLLALSLFIGWILISNPTGRPNGGNMDSTSISSAVTSQEDAGSVEGSVAPEVTTFLNWNDAHATSDSMTPDHRHTATGIRSLASALGALAGTADDATVKREVVALGNHADTLEQNTASTIHARHARVAFVSLGALLLVVQQNRFPDLAAETGAVLDAADALDANRPLLDQRSRVRHFFNRAAGMVRQMSDQ